MTKKQLIENIAITAMCGGFPLTPEQILGLHKITVKRIREGIMLACTGFVDVLLDPTSDVTEAVKTVSEARKSLL